MNTGPIRQILKRFAKGNASVEEQNLVNYWYGSFDDEMLQISDTEKDRIKEEIWNDIEQRISFNQAVIRKRRQWLRVAAIFLPLLVLGIGYLKYYRNDVNQTFTTYTTGAGQRTTITMKEGTVLHINAGSTIRVADDLSKERTVELVDGEVFFDVYKQPNVPFIIKNQTLTTRVLGTAFNISAYKNIPTFSIAVVRGSVEVSDAGRGLRRLQKSEELIFDRKNRSFIVKPMDEQVLDWQKGYLVLNNVSFDEMVVLVEKNFGVTITTTQNKIRKSRYTTQLPTNMKPLDAVEVLAAIHHFKTSGRSNHIIFYE